MARAGRPQLFQLPARTSETSTPQDVTGRNPPKPHVRGSLCAREAEQMAQSGTTHVHDINSAIQVRRTRTMCECQTNVCFITSVPIAQLSTVCARVRIVVMRGSPCACDRVRGRGRVAFPCVCVWRSLRLYRVRAGPRDDTDVVPSGSGSDWSSAM